MKIADKRKLIIHIDELIRVMPSIRKDTSWHEYTYQMDTPYGPLIIKPDTIKDADSEVYTIFARFLEGKDIHPSNTYTSSAYKYNLHCMYTDGPETIIERAIHHLTII